MDSHDKGSLTTLVEKAVEQTNGRKIKLGDMVDNVGSRGFGPLLIVPGIFVLLPTGAIPGVPAAMGAIIAFCSVQIMIGRERPWLPESLRNIAMTRRKAEAVLEEKKGIIRKIDNIMNRRLELLTRRPVQRMTGVITLLLSLAMIVIGFIRFAPDMMVLPILLFGLGFLAHDGLFVLLGFLVLIGAGFFIPLI